MCNGTTDLEKMQLTQKEVPDPATQRRQQHLFSQAEQYAGGLSPFQQEYGYGQQMAPGLGGMSQTGQQYLTDRILGKGAYRVQNLGFQGYQRPEDAPVGGYQYGPSGYYAGEQFKAPTDPNYVFKLGAGQEQAWQRAYQDPSTWYNYMSAELGDAFQPTDDQGQVLSADEWAALPDAERQAIFASQGTPEKWGNPWANLAPTGWDVVASGSAPASYGNVSAEEWAQRMGGSVSGSVPGSVLGGTRGTRTGTGGAVGVLGQPGQSRIPPDLYPGQPGYLEQAKNADGTLQFDANNEPVMVRQRTDWSPWMGETWEEGAPSGMAGVNQPGYELNIWDTPDLPFGAQNLPTGPTQGVPASAAEYAARTGGLRGGGLLQTDLTRPTSGVGIGEIEDARTATRRLLLEQGRTGDPAYQTRLAIDQFLPGQVAVPGQAAVPPGWLGTEASGYRQFMDVPTGGTAPGAWEGGDKASGVGDLLTATSPWEELGVPGTGVAPDETYISTLGSSGVPAADLIRGLPGSREFGVEAPTATDLLGIPDIEAQEIADVGEGYTGDAVTAGALTGTEPNVRVDPITGAVTQDVLGVAPTPIAAPGEVTVDPVTGQVTQAVAGVTPDVIAGPGGVTVDPITGQTTQAVADVDPTAFTGASFLGGDLGAYMDVGGVGAQVTAAQQSYEQAQNVEQARRAQSLAWGTRGDIPRAEQERQMLAQIADIRRKGYTDAADRMEADLQRQQAAGMQTQQLTAQTGMQAQQLEAQRRESDAARAQQALIQGQQLGTQADLQYQQLAQQGGIRGAELGLQAQMQGQQLEAQRRSEDAARAQQAALSGQQLGTQAALQTQQLGQAGDIRTAELDTQIGLAGQQLQAQRREADAARSQQAAMQAQQLDTEARLQEQRLGTGRTQRKTELDLQAALANQQAALQTGSQTQQLEAQRAVRQAELDLQQQQAVSGVGADVAMQRQQLEVQAQIQTAQNQLEAARADQQAAFQSGNAQAQLEAQRQMRESELRLQRAQQTQQLGAGAAAQQTQLEFARRQELAGMGQAAATQQTALEAQRRSQLAEMGLTSAQQQAENEFLRRQGLAEIGLQAQGMGMDDAARFRAQQMQAAQQLAGLGGMEQAATFGAAEQLAQMGMTQEQRQQMQAAADYDQWLRSQEGFADEAAFLQAMQPTAGMAQYQRKPSVWGQVAGGLLSAGGAAATAFGSDVRIKDNVEYVGMENGFKTYEFNYLGRDNRYRGVMAQEVMLERPDAVEIQDGFYRVNYDAIGVQFEAV